MGLEEAKLLGPPEEWIPRGASVVVAARQRDDGYWESLMPQFSIAGMGETPIVAIEQARELLFDYLALCARDGQSFEQCDRRMGWQTMLSGLREYVWSEIRERILLGSHSGYRRERLMLHGTHS